MVQCNLMKFIFSFSVLMLASLWTAHASTTEFSPYNHDLFDQMEREFNTLSNVKDQRELVARPLNKKYLHTRLREQYYEEQPPIDPKQLSEGVTSELIQSDGTICFDKTTVLALAIQAGQARLVKKFLTVVEDINDPTFLIWGNMQPYNMAHLAICPDYDSPARNDYPEERLDIIDSLAGLGVDFNFIYIYKDGPKHRNSKPPVDTFINDLMRPTDLQLRALLYGADPLLNEHDRRYTILDVCFFSDRLVGMMKEMKQAGITVNIHQNMLDLLRVVQKINDLKRQDFRELIS